LPKQDKVQEIPPTAVQAPPTSNRPVSEILDVSMQNPHGLHLRPAALLIKTLSRFPAEVLIENRTGGRGPIFARSLVDVNRLQIQQGDSVRFSISAADPQPVIEAIRSLVESQFGESAPATGPADTADAPNALRTFGVSSGIAVGRPLLFDLIGASIPADTLETPMDIEREMAKLRSALAASVAEFDRRIHRLRSLLNQHELDIFEAQRMIIADPTILQEVQAKIQESHMNAAAAWCDSLSRYAADQEKAVDPYLRARAVDFREAERAVLGHLTSGKTGFRLPAMPFAEPTMLVCQELTPTLAEELHRISVAGVIQLAGGATSHGAILARALGLPAIGGARNFLEQLRSARRVAISGAEGFLWIDPPPDVLSDLVRREQLERSELEQALRESGPQALTKDGILVEVGANAGSATDIAAARTNGAEFVGLFRSEFLFQNFERAPDEEQQLAAYHEALAASGGSMRITLRLLDAGGDKPLSFLQPPEEANPFLGVRGIRLLMANPWFFRTHLRALLRLADVSPIQLMLPMVTDLSEILATKKLLGEIAAELAKEGLPHRWPIAVGAMIETPAAGLLIDKLLPHLDFASVGTNDLTQYTLCAERGNPSLSAFADSLHPAVLRICDQVIRAAEKQRTKISICGESASDPEALPIWLALGFREFSVNAAAIPATKSLLRRCDASDITVRLTARHFSFEDAAEVRQFSRDLSRRTEPPTG
jgi:multiphosphoryl transfer protein